MKIVIVDNPPVQNIPLQGLTTVVHFRMGQSNDTIHAENNYAATIGGRWDGTSVNVTNQKNPIGAFHENSEAENIQFIWEKEANGGTQLVEYCPGGTYYDAMIAKYKSLLLEYGKVDLFTMFIGESNAGAGTTRSQYLTLINTFIAGVESGVRDDPAFDALPALPTVFVGIGPGNMADVLDSQEESIRDGYRDVGLSRSDFYYVDLTNNPTDDDINNHHYDRGSSVQGVAEEIRKVVYPLLGLPI